MHLHQRLEQARNIRENFELGSYPDRPTVWARCKKCGATFSGFEGEVRSQAQFHSHRQSQSDINRKAAR